MKKVFLTALAALCAAGAWAAPVTVDRAKATAAAFMKAKRGSAVSVKDVVSKNDTYYIINLNPGGWVIVSADDIVNPILGYSATGSLKWHAIPENFRGMLDVYKSEITTIKHSGLKTQDSRWKSISRPGMLRMNSRAGEGIIDNLIPVNFNQSAPFNKYCPGSTSSKNKALVGCVAVAMSQAMTAQRFPAQPQGMMEYSAANYGLLSINFDTEKPYDWEAIISGKNSQDEAARLLYHAGMSVRMNYGVEGSGIPSNEVYRITDALADNFGYAASDLSYKWRDSYKGDWDALILNELNAGRAVIYNAVDNVSSSVHAGHSFNVDGYDGDGMFHVNWGWGGVGNGYFALNRLESSALEMNYNAMHVAILGIGSPNQVLKSITLTDEIIDEKMPAGTVVSQILVNGAPLESTFSIDIFGAYDPQRKEYLDIPFEVKKSGENHLLVTKSVLSAQDEPIEVNIKVQDSKSGTRLTSSFKITVCKLRTIAQATALSFDRTTGEILVKTRNGLSYSLTGKNGVKISEGSLSPVPHLTIKLSQLDEGENILTLTDGSASKSIKLKK